MSKNIVLNHDGEISIALGKSRKERNWVNKRVKYSELLNKLRLPNFTRETMEEYRNFDKALQDNIKDVGGFVGGSLKEGKRRRDTVLHRDLLTLDIDFGAPAMVEKVKEKFKGGCCFYSTHKHTKGKPRLRLIIPISRSVTPEEYEAIGRWIASTIGMDYFDDTTYEPSRLMYWQSTSKDGEYVFEYVDKPWVNADEILGFYEDWTQVSQWPHSSRAKAKEINLRQQQKKPQEKGGAEGIFCRTYSVTEAIDKYLGKVYESTLDPLRYTFKEGSTCGGLVIYEGGDFAYSFHSTDPASGKLLNAFNLVKVHRFGNLDKDISEKTSIAKRPSTLAMNDLAIEDETVKETLGREVFEEGENLFQDGNFQEADCTWMTKLDTDNSGKYKATTKNIVTIFENDPNLKGRIAHNEFSQRVIIRDSLPWHKINNCDCGDCWEEWDDAFIRYYIESVYGMYSPMRISDGFVIMTEKNKYHPIREYLNNLKWDGKERVETLFIDYLGAEDCEYTRVVTRKILTAAVARVFEPGRKFDWMLVLVGKQGIGKSHILSLLGKSWFSDSFTTVIGKEAYEQLQDAWIIEVCELTATKKAEEEAVKQFIAKREDNYRMAYGRRVSRVPRQCVFFGTTNTTNFLRDTTGNRRFWPVMTGVHPIERNLFEELSPEVIDQYWAEAMDIYNKKEVLHLNPREEAMAEKVQARHTESNSKEGPIRRYLEMKLPKEWKSMDIPERRQFIGGGDFETKWVGTEIRTRVCAMEIWIELLGGDIKNFYPYLAREINDILKTIEGWEEYGEGRGRLRFGIHGIQKAFIRKKDELN